MTAPAIDVAQLRPGDTLLYRPTAFSVKKPLGWFFGRLIAAKTWHNVSHVETYVGARQFGARPFLDHASVASRDGLGVNVYPLRLTELAYVLRPRAGARVDLAAGWRWFLTVQGQKYDWLGLTRFVRTSIKASTTKMFCSAFWLRYYRACGFDAFAAHVDADSIAPGEILNAPGLDIIWTDGADGVVVVEAAS